LIVVGRAPAPAAWAPLEGRELSADMAIRRLRQLEGDVEGFYLQLQVIRRLLETPEDCDCGRIMPAMPRGGGNGKKA
jgi:hypothetical protein